MAIEGKIFRIADKNTESTRALLSQLGRLIGVRKRADGRYHLSDICQSRKVNKWSRKKGIRFPKWVNLADDEFIGTVADNNNDIYFGIVFPASGSAMLDANISAIHDATFEYQRPRGCDADIFEPNRIRDFNGYDHAAEPNPVGKFNKSYDGTLTGYIDDYGDESPASTGGLRDITVDYLQTNDTGINLVEIYQSQLGEDFTEAALERTYPCILISNEDGTMNYFTALHYVDDSGEVYTRPILFNGEVARRGAWVVRFRKPLRSNINVGDEVRYPFEQDMDGLRASLFLLQSSSAYSPELYPLIDFGENWIDVSDGIAASYKAIVVPEDNGIPLKLRRWMLYNYFVLGASGVTHDSLGFSVHISINQQPEEVQRANVSVTLELIDSGASATKTAVINTDSSFFVTFRDIDLDLAQGAIGEVDVMVTIKTTIGGKSATYAERVRVTL